MTDRTLRVSNAILLAIRDGVLPEKLIIGMLAVKLNYVDSIMRNVSVRSFASLLHCGKDTATEILKKLDEYNMTPDENKSLNVCYEVKFYRKEMFKGIGGYQKLYVRNNKVYIKLGEGAKGYDITYRNLKKILLMLTELNFIQQVKRMSDQEESMQKAVNSRPKSISAKRKKTMMLISARHKKWKAYKHGVSYEVIANKIGTSVRTAKRITKELSVIGAIAISNPTNLHVPIETIDYNATRILAQRGDESDYKNMSAIDMFKAFASKEDPILKEHRKIMDELNRKGYKTVKSFTTTSLGKDGKYRTCRNYYAMLPNKYQSLV